MIFGRKNDYNGQEDYSNLGYVPNLDQDNILYQEQIPMLPREEILNGSKMTEDEESKQSRLFALLESGENPEEAERLAQELGESWGI